MIPLKQISIPKPCPARWDEMTGDAQTRFCTGCQKNVHNLSEMSRREGEGLLTRTDANVCVFFYPDADGAPLPREDVPADFPLTSRPRPTVWRRAWAATLSGLAAVALALGGGGAQAIAHGKASNAHGTKPGVRQRMLGRVVRLAPPKPPKAPKTVTPAPLGGKPAPPPALLGGAPMVPPPPPHHK